MNPFGCTGNSRPHRRVRAPPTGSQAGVEDPQALQPLEGGRRAALRGEEEAAPQGGQEAEVRLPQDPAPRDPGRAAAQAPPPGPQEEEEGALEGREGGVREDAGHQGQGAQGEEGRQQEAQVLAQTVHQLCLNKALLDNIFFTLLNLLLFNLF